MNKNLKMNAKVEFIFLKPLTDKTDLSFDIGTLEFTVNQKCVPIEFDQVNDKCEFNGNTVVVSIEAGYAANNYKESILIEPAKCQKEEAQSLGDITSKSISKATQINIFDVWPLIDHEELDDDAFKMTIMKIAFTDSFGSHMIGQDPINAFNAAFNKA